MDISKCKGIIQQGPRKGLQCQRDIIDTYRADGILILFKTKNTDEITKFKAYTESYAGDNPTDPKWIKRWTEFTAAVEKEPTDESKKKLISKFLSAQRKKKMDRKMP